VASRGVSVTVEPILNITGGQPSSWAELVVIHHCGWRRYSTTISWC